MFSAPEPDQLLLLQGSLGVISGSDVAHGIDPLIEESFGDDKASAYASNRQVSFTCKSIQGLGAWNSTTVSCSLGNCQKWLTADLLKPNVTAVYGICSPVTNRRSASSSFRSRRISYGWDGRWALRNAPRIGRTTERNCERRTNHTDPFGSPLWTDDLPGYGPTVGWQIQLHSRRMTSVLVPR